MCAPSPLQSIKELDIKRVSQIERTWKEVNESFGKIFSTLLPGTTAKLVTTEGGCLEDGLEVKVGFGGVWKESLSELSGGQRSLIALSLVFALLKFRPAPLYILDEVRRSLCFVPCVSNSGRLWAPVSQLDIVMAKAICVVPCVHKEQAAVRKQLKKSVAQGSCEDRKGKQQREQRTPVATRWCAAETVL